MSLDHQPAVNSSAAIFSSFKFSVLAKKPLNVTCDDVIHAIQSSNNLLAKEYLSENPALILQKNAFHTTPLHAALKYGSFELVKFVLSSLKQFKKNEIQFILHIPDLAGFTPLHLAAEFGEAETFYGLIKALGDDASRAAKKINDNGHLPLQLVDKNKRGDEKIIRRGLEKLSFDRQFKPLHIPVDFAHIKKSYANLIADNPLLKIHLALGCNAVNDVRKKITASWTHPSINFLSADQFSEIKAECQTARDEYSKLIGRTSLLQTMDEVMMSNLKNIVQVVTKHGRGNCYEHSCLVLDRLLKQNIKSTVEIINIQNGDHTFVVIGRMSGSNLNDFTTWGDFSVVVDAWSGDVYPASKLPTKLKDFVLYDHGKTGCITFPYHPEYHRFEIDKDVHLSERYFTSGQSASYSAAPNDVSIMVSQDVFFKDKHPVNDAKAASFWCASQSDWNIRGNVCHSECADGGVYYNVKDSSLRSG